MDQKTLTMELLALATALHSGAATDDERARLEMLLEGSVEARTIYLRISDDTVTLSDVGSSLGAQGDCPSEGSASLHESMLLDRPDHRWIRPFAIATCILAVLIGGGSLWYLNHDKALDQSKIAEADPVPSKGAPTAARLTSLAPGSRWSCGRPGARNPEVFCYGDTVRVEEGIVEMTLEGGTVGQLHTPVILQLLSEDRIRLLHGQIKVHVPEQAQGFTVETPWAELVDLGTVFSVEADDTGTDLVVFKGRVDLRVPGNTLEEGSIPTKIWQFCTGQAVHVDTNGTLSRIMQVQSSALPLASNALNPPPLIASVTDNNLRANCWAFYEIVQGGMGEDAQVFVDRPHEWNGLTESGMPSYLVGADYVKSFNDDKVAEDLRITVKTTAPVTLYVLLDLRVYPPAWLTEAFTDTGDQIGIDEAPHDSKDHTHYKDGFIEVGPGDSIDVTYSIWKRTIPEAGTVVLGPNGRVPTKRKLNRAVRSVHASMYGIVAVPLKTPQKATAVFRSPVVGDEERASGISH